LLKPTIKQTGTTDRERYLSKVSENTFFGLWSYPNPYTDEGASKSGSGKELCDLLVIFENKIVIFSDKDISFNTETDLPIAWKRWFKRAVIRSAKQLLGAESWIRNFPDRIFLDKECKNKFPIPFSTNEYEIHLVAVTCNTAKPAQKHWGGGSSGTFYQIYPFGANECLEHPFIVGDIFPGKTFVHVLDELSLDLLLQELNTISDFVNYLEEKERSIRSGEIIQAAGEEELLAHYFQGRDHFQTSGKMIHPTGNIQKDGPVSLTEGLWDEYTNEETYSVLLETLRDSLFWDMLIEKFSHHILHGTVGRGVELEFEHHERAIRHLAAEDRFSRYLLATAFREKFLEVPPDRRSGRVMFSPSNKEKIYIFLFLPRDKDQKYEDYRDERSSYVEAYALVAKHKYPRAKNVIVIATEPVMAEGRSEDIFSVEFNGNLSNEEKKEAQKLITEARILSDISPHRVNPFSPDTKSPHRNKRTKYGRNEKCPCGSGKKYKKCCL